MKIKSLVATASLLATSLAYALSVNPELGPLKLSRPDAVKYGTLRPQEAKAQRATKLRPPGVTVVNEGFRSMSVRYTLSPDHSLGDGTYTFGIGLNPNDPNDIEGQFWTDPSTNGLAIDGKCLDELNQICETKGYPLLKIGDKVRFAVKINAKYSDNTYEDSDWKIVETTITNPALGQAAGTTTISFGRKSDTPDWNSATRDSITRFLNNMLPVMKEIYGPPAHSNNITLVRDKNMISSNMYMHNPNEVWTYAFDPQLLTHELVHAMRDFSCLSSSRTWTYDPWLMGFEEGFAQAYSYIMMNAYADKYPKDQIYGSDGAYYFASRRGADYDFWNNNVLTTKDYWSAGNSDGTGVGYRRYEMGAMAIYKIYIEDPDFAKHFNAEYYKRLNADINYYPTREGMIDIIETVLKTYGRFGATIEGRSVRNWINMQRIFDCYYRTGYKVYNANAFYPSWNGSYMTGRLYYFETFNNGSEWADRILNQDIFHHLNGAVADVKVYNAKNQVIARRLTRTEPTGQPDPTKDMNDPNWCFASAQLDFTDVDFASYKEWPKGDETSYVQLKKFGLYRIVYNMEHPNGGPAVGYDYCVVGDSLRNFKGVYGGVVEDPDGFGINPKMLNGKIWFQHENSPEDGPYIVKDGSFMANVPWAGFMDKGGYCTKPGKVYVRFEDAATGITSYDQRNINDGNSLGQQLFLFHKQDMRPGKYAIESLADKNFALEQNYPNPFNPQTNIAFRLQNRGEVSLLVYNAKGELVQELVQGSLEAGKHQVSFNAAGLNSGVYFYKLQTPTGELTKKMLLLK